MQTESLVITTTAIITFVVRQYPRMDGLEAARRLLKLYCLIADSWLSL